MREKSLSVCILIFILILPVQIAEQDYVNRLITWNVGQGQWVTWVRSTSCLHFDLGGEKKYWPKFKTQLMRFCQNKKNEAFISHWDWDHINLISFARQSLPNFCLHGLPHGKPSKSKLTYLKKNQICQKHKHFKTRELKFDLAHASASASNEYSHVFTLINVGLVPGDSPISMEKRWIQHLSKTNTINLLILGHHGSQTSTSQELLQRLPHLKTSIASARKRRYGHPHKRVEQRIKKQGVSLLRTEIWGNIQIELF